MYDPDSYTGEGRMPVLYARTSDGAINQWQCWVQDCHVWVEWGQKDGALQQANFVCSPKNTGRANSTTAEEQAVKECIAKWKKQVKKKYHPSLDDATTSLNLKPMLAHKYGEHHERGKITWPVDVQPKFDGLRCFAYMKDGRAFLQSRGGDPYTVHHVATALDGRLSPTMVLDGELYVHGMALQKITSLVKRPQEESLELTYQLYDLTFTDNPNVPWLQRKSALTGWYLGHNFSQHTPVIQLVETDEATCHDEVIACHNDYVQKGYEGAIVRQHHGHYRFGYRSHELLKHKEFIDEEFLIVGYTRGKGKFSNVPIYNCVTAEGGAFDVVPRGTDAERARMLAEADAHIGQMLNVRYFQLTEDRIPQFPVGIYIREPGT